MQTQNVSLQDRLTAKDLKNMYNEYFEVNMGTLDEDEVADSDSDGADSTRMICFLPEKNGNRVTALQGIEELLSVQEVDDLFEEYLQTGNNTSESSDMSLVDVDSSQNKRKIEESVAPHNKRQKIDFSRMEFGTKEEMLTHLNVAKSLDVNGTHEVRVYARSREAMNGKWFARVGVYSRQLNMVYVNNEWLTLNNFNRKRDKTFMNSWKLSIRLLDDFDFGSESITDGRTLFAYLRGVDDRVLDGKDDKVVAHIFANNELMQTLHNARKAKKQEKNELKRKCVTICQEEFPSILEPKLFFCYARVVAKLTKVSKK